MARYVLKLEEIDSTQLALAGGKGASLGALMRLDGVRVPPGFCVTTDAFRRVVAPSIRPLLDQLASAKADEVPSRSAALRRAIEQLPIPDEVAAEIIRAAAPLGACAVRSSATAEDLPTASFAGQQDTFLNVVGATEILRHVSRCWASLFTERAVAYRARNGFDHRKVQMAVVVQQMVTPETAGVMFTADPVTSNRKVASIEAVFGLGEALVSGQVKADVFKVRDGALVSKNVVGKHPTLTDDQAVALAALGRRVEAHFGRPQDIEWCFADGEFQLVQSRAITTLFPIPVANDSENHVYVSVAHGQMMTDAMKPLGISMWQLTALAPMSVAGGRLFVDVTKRLSSPASRAPLLQLFGRGDPLSKDAMQTIAERPGFLPPPPDAPPGPPAPMPPPGAAPPPLETDPSIVAQLIARFESSLAAATRDLQTKATLSEVAEFILSDLGELKRLLSEPLSFRVIMAGLEATWWLNDHLLEWLGEKNAADVLAQSAPGNVTSEMGLALLDVADAVRPHPEVVSFLERVRDDSFLDALPRLDGGRNARAAIVGWLDKYGMRCIGEIDITKPRWSERPATLVPMILANVKNFERGEAARRFEQGKLEASRKETELLARLRELPDGEAKADETKRMIHRKRAFIGYREYPKYGWMCRYFLYKQALVKEAKRLGRDEEDLFFLTLEELRAAAFDEAVIRERRDAFRSYQALNPPRVITSEGEVISGSYRRSDFPAGALVGLAVSAGTVEGRARVLFDPGEAVLEPGDILVTTGTDPSWTPVFVGIKGLVTEVGGLMTHGSVIAREYGLPAVVGVDGATKLIRDGQRVRVHGTAGYVELLSD